MSELSAIYKVQAVEDAIKQLPPVEITTNHYFAGGIYEREILVPAGSVITGKIHLHEHLAKLIKGTITIYDGDNQGTYTAPMTFSSLAGAKRAGYAHDDVVFSTFHYVGDNHDIVKIENDLVTDSIEQYQISKESNLCLS